jgi:hypothetical protein
MINYPITKTEKTTRGATVHTLADGSKRTYSDVRAGLVWPSAISPAYYCILGEDDKGVFRDPENPYNRGVLHLIAEQEFRALSIERLCKALYDDAIMYRVSVFYCDLNDDQNEYYHAIRDYGHHMQLKDVRCEDAPFKGNFQAGLAIVDDWGQQGLVDIPKDTIAYEQFKKASDKSLAHTDVDQEFYAANALRFAVSGFFKYRPSVYHKKATWRRKNRRGMAV